MPLLDLLSETATGLPVFCLLLFYPILLLVIGRATRSRQVLWMAVGCAAAGIAGLALWSAISLADIPSPVERRYHVTMTRALAAAWVFLLGVCVWALRRTPGTTDRPAPKAKPATPSADYDRAWLLSLLQSRQPAAAEGFEIFSTDPADPSDPLRSRETL